MVDRVAIPTPDTNKKRSIGQVAPTPDTNKKRSIGQVAHDLRQDVLKRPRITAPVESWKKCRHSDLPARKSILSQICNEMRNSRPNINDAVLERLKDAARQIELALYEAAPTKAEYIDITTLKVRIRSFFDEGQARRHNSNTISNHGSPTSKNDPKNSKNASDEAKKSKSSDVIVKIRRRRLLHLYHASHCKDDNCKIKNCSENKSLFQHVVHCEKECCDYEKCVSSRYLLIHFRVCTNPNCAVCSVVREKMVSDKKKSINVKRSLFSNHYVRSSIKSLSSIVSKKECKKAVPKAADSENKHNEMDKRFVRACISGTGPNFLEHLPVPMISQHLRALKVEKLQPIVFPVLRKLMEHKHNRNIFNFPVDPVALNIPHYSNVIKSPMDFGTVRQKLEDGKYSNFDDFDRDMRLVLNNAMKFNPPHHPVHVIAAKFLQTYDNEVEKLRPKLLHNYRYHSKFSRQPNAKSKCNLCFQTECEVCPLCEKGCIAYEPRVIYCSANCTARIQRNVYYYCTPAHTYCFCTECVDKQKKKNFIEVQGGPKIKKTDLIKKKNNDLISEPWVSCDVCDKWCHQTCALYNHRKDDSSKHGKYICPPCLINQKKSQEDKTQTNVNGPLKAVDLAQTDLCTFIERWIRQKYSNLQLQGQNDGRAIKGDIGPPSSSLTVRLIHNFEEICKLKGYAKKCLDMVPQKIKYSSKCLTLFQELDGVDTLIFVMFVQEYGDKLNVEQVKSEQEGEQDCFDEDSHPNKRKIYIAYLDSIHYFRPRRFRTDIYQSFMLSYLEYSRRRGFYNAYIWACPPPNKRDDYILHCHPEDQRVPNPERLRQWYHTMAQAGVKLGIVTSTSSMFAEHFIPKVEPQGQSKGRKSKKKALADIIALSKPKAKPTDGKSGKEMLFSCESDIVNNGPVGGFRGKNGSTTKPATKWKKNKLAFNQKMPYFDGDYWPQELEEIGKDEDLKRKKKLKFGSKYKTEPTEQETKPLTEMSSEEIRTVLFSRLADQLNAMKQDFLVVKLAYECTICGKYLPRERYECRHPDFLSHTPESIETPWDKRSSYVLCEDCVVIEAAKEPDERHTGELPLVQDSGCIQAKGSDVDDNGEAHSNRLKINLVSESMQLVKVVELVPEILSDANPIKKNEYMESRHAFLSLCSGNRYQFNQLRRAKASTLMVLYHLHNPKAPAHLYSCSKCQEDILSKFRYHCTKCPEFNLCEACFNTSRHEHQLHAFRVTRALKQQNNSEAERHLADSRRARVQSIQIYLHFLNHATRCKDKECRFEFCAKIKNLQEHVKKCPNKNDVKKCPMCRDFLILLRLQRQIDL